MPSRTAKAANRRGSPDVVDKRRAARQFNEVLAEVGAGGAKLDGRTEKRRKRMLEELRAGKTRGAGRSLKPIDVLVRVNDLLELGEPIASIRKASKPPRPVPASPDVIESLRRLHAAYGFRPQVYLFVGLDERAIAKAGLAPRAGDRGGRPSLARSRASGAAGVGRAA
ncbi:MAG: hypothetical protein IPM79_27055 [Polyangiaceae bacterium]|nr:hypothetical protein [Polyangiaceae bacterium]MBK8941168.1 hypothetical protein [Polyangiaceae bacterium]